MSKTKEYIDKLKTEEGIDVLVPDTLIDDEYLYEKYLESLRDMNKIFEEKEDKEEK